MSGRIGRKNAVLVSLAVTVAAMGVPLFASAERWYLYVVAFALVGIGNTIIQAALPAIMSNVVEPQLLASRISLGQFVKAVCAALTPVFVYLTATAFGNWKLLFPLYGALGLVVPGEGYAEIFKPLDRRLGALAERAGWDFIRGEIKSADPKVRAREVRRLAYQFSNEHVTGVFFQPLEFLKDAPKASEEAVRYFDEAGIAVVLLDYDIAPPPSRSRYDLVGIDNVAAGLAVGRHLVSSGARRIAFLHRPHAAPTVTNRMRGVASAVIESGGTWSLKDNVLFAEPGNRRAVSKFLANGLPDAFVAGNDVAAAALGETLAKIGGGAENVRPVGFDDVEIAAKLGLTTMRQPLDAIAEIALQTLVSRIKTPTLPPRTILLNAELVVR